MRKVLTVVELGPVERELGVERVRDLIHLHLSSAHKVNFGRNRSHLYIDSLKKGTISFDAYTHSVLN